MKTRRRIFAAPLALALSFTMLSSAPLSGAGVTEAAPQQQEQGFGVLERGYRTGYSDGYQAGWSDTHRRAPNDYRSKAAYKSADRAYADAFGPLEDYRDGYRQGFEVGYEAGYSRRGFDSSTPARLSRRGVSADDGQDRAGRSGVGDADDDDNQVTKMERSNDVGGIRGARSIPSGTILRVELLSRLSTDVSHRGDRFEARVIEAGEFEGAIVGGRLTNVERSGKTRGRSQLQLDFDQIRMPNGDWEDFSAQVVEVIGSGDEGVGEVDPEGGVRGKSTTKDDIAKVGASTGIGAIIGAIAGGGKGAGIGAIIGGAAGTAGVLNRRGEDIRLERGQKMRIRVTGNLREN